MTAPVPVRHLLNLLHSDVEAIIARAPQMTPGDRQIALELAIALAFNCKPRPIDLCGRPLQIAGSGG